MSAGTKSLTDCPSNLKEAIDWILRVTGKDGQSGGQNASQELAKAVTQLLEGVKDINSKITIDHNLIDHLATGLAKFIGYDGAGSSNNIGNGGIAVGKGGGTNQPPLDAGDNSSTKGYKLTYDSSATWQKQVESGGDAEANKTICAKIFLGCVPMIFSALSYLYWRCDKKGNGEWRGMQFSGANKIYELKNFMVGMGYKASELSGNIGQTIVQSVTKDTFEDFKEGIQLAKQAATERAKKENEVKKKIYRGTSSQSSSTSAKPTYTEFLKQLCEQRSVGPLFTQSNGKSISSLYYISRLYFTAKQIMLSNAPELKPRPPSTIREMLYFLAALPFSPRYDKLNSHITKDFQSLVNNDSVSTDAELMIPVADSGVHSQYNTLSAANLKDYLITTCSLSLVVLGIIQGPGASEKSGEPWLHELFSNNAFHLMYPSGPILFNMLSGYTYALQFQLYFLYAQCYSTYSLGSGWRACRYGSGVNSSTNGKRVTSHICSAGCNKSSNGHTISSHSGAKCTHNDCGTSDNQSPLQAFLIDNLKGFTHSLPGSPSHLSNHPTSSMCHVRMGFHPEHLRHNAGTGNYIYSALASFCSGPDTPLRQLCEKLGCLTKRAPRSLGDLFGFIWHLNYQLFNSAQILDKLKEALRTNSNSVEDFIEKLKKSLPSLPSSAEDSGLVKSLKAMASIIPFLYQLFMVKPDEFLPVTLFNVVQHCHKVEHSNNIIKIVHKDSSDSSLTSGHNCSSSPNDLWSLCQPVGPAPGGGEDAHAACRGTNCGGYLYSLTHSDGATYAPAYAPVYLSWVSYLVDDLETGLQELFDVFKGLNCSGCTKCVPGSHGSSKDSPCPSIVDCDGVLPLLYRHGFQFYDARWLKGMKSENKNGQWEWTQNDHLKRTCNKFSSQVQSVLSPYAPLATLLESIDSFLYMFRFYFFYNLSSFWLCSLAILLYFIFYGIDVLHVKSHVHLPSSHTVPPIGLLTTGKAPALTKLTYYMP